MPHGDIMVHMSTTKGKRKQRGGVKKRQRTAILIRVDPSVAAMLTSLAGSSIGSRNQMIEAWLLELCYAEAEDRGAVDAKQFLDRYKMLPLVRQSQAPSAPRSDEQ
jgi:hypothetical protein